MIILIYLRIHLSRVTYRALTIKCQFIKELVMGL